MTTLVETSEEEPTLAVARVIAELAWSQGGPEVGGEVLHFGNVKGVFQENFVFVT